jgi:positive phototaxis protein PixI
MSVPDISAANNLQRAFDAEETLHTGPVSASDVNAYLEFYVGEHHPLLLPMTSLVEIITPVAGQIVPMFQMPPWVMGVYNWRGDVLWMVDLGQFLGFQPWYTQSGLASKYTTVILDAAAVTDADNPAAVGLVVSRVEGMVSCPEDAVSKSSTVDIPAKFYPYVGGYWDGSGLAEPRPPRPILDGAALAKAMANPGSVT